MGLDKYTTVPISGIKVLLVDRDVTCLAIITKMLQILGYEVKMASRAYDALEIIEKTKVHLVIMDLHLSKMGFYDLIDIIEEKYHIPSFAMSVVEDNNSVLQALLRGAKLCFRKPLAFSDINNLWQFALWRRKDGTVPSEHLGPVKNELEWKKTMNKGKEIAQRDAKWKEKEVVVVEDKGGKENEAQGKRKQRMVWTEILHNKFIEAVNLAGIDAPPKKIHQYMNVPGITKQNISSYLQKYRQTLKRKAAEMNYLTDTKSYDSNMGSHSLPHKGFIGVNPLQVHGNPAYFPTMKTPSIEDLTFSKNRWIPQMTLQGTAHGASSSSNEFKTSSSESLVHWANREAPIELSPVESATNGNASYEGAILSGVDHKTTTTTLVPYLGMSGWLLESNNTSFVDHTGGKTEMQCSTLPAQLSESNNTSSVNYTTGKTDMQVSAFLANFFEVDDTSSVDYIANKNKMQRLTLPANNGMSQQFPEQLPVQPAPSYEKKLDFLDAEFVDTDELFNMSKETMEVYEELGSWLPKV